MAEDWKKKLGNSVVYSTNPDYKPASDDDEIETLPNNKQLLYISLDKKQRKGKTVTLVEGFVGKNEDLEVLAKLLKTKCGVGGSAKDNEIIIQGDFKLKVKEILEKENYKVKVK